MRDDEDKISVRDVYGLWLILTGAITISWILFAIRYAGWYPDFVERLHKIHITAREAPLEDDRKVGDELIVDNLKDVTYRLMTSLERELEQRLEAMDEKITKFYDILLKDEKGEEEN